MTPPPAAAAAPAVHPRRTGNKSRAPAPRRAAGRPAPLTVPSAPRRVSGPARHRVSERPARARAEGVSLGLIAALEGLSRHRLLDRLIRGRGWIALVAFALIGIVTMQLGLLKLNGGIGRALEQEALLQRENAALSIENSELAAGGPVASRAGQIGMQFVPAGALRFLAIRPVSDLTRAAAAAGAPIHTSRAPTEGGSSTAAPSTEASTSGERSESSEPSITQSATKAPSNTEAAGTPSAEANGAGESTSAPASARPPAPATGAGAAEATPAGGTEASPTGG
jgi:hypothetical protein